MRNDWVFPDDIDASALADEMTEALASTDSMLRDRLALTGFYHLVIDGRLSDEKCRSLFSELIGDRHLLCGLGKECDDSVFNRSFSVLSVDNFILYNRTVNRRLLSDDEIRNAFRSVLKCFIEEKDLRDFDDVKGWAHVVSHAGGVLESFMADEATGRNDAIDVLTAIKDKICIDSHCYRCNEDESLAGVVFAILERKLVSEDEFSDWIASFLSYVKTGDLLKDGRLLHNRYHFFGRMNHRLRDAYPNLHPYVWNAIVELMEQEI